MRCAGTGRSPLFRCHDYSDGGRLSTRKPDADGGLNGRRVVGNEKINNPQPPPTSLYYCCCD